MFTPAFSCFHEFGVPLDVFTKVAWLLLSSGSSHTQHVSPTLTGGHYVLLTITVPLAVSSSQQDVLARVERERLICSSSTSHPREGERKKKIAKQHNYQKMFYESSLKPLALSSMPVVSSLQLKHKGKRKSGLKWKYAERWATFHVLGLFDWRGALDVACKSGANGKWDWLQHCIR